MAICQNLWIVFTSEWLEGEVLKFNGHEYEVGQVGKRARQLYRLLVRS